MIGTILNTGRRRLALRIGLVYFAVTGGVLGVWALLFPRSFYEQFPLSGHGWVGMLPPYNEHLITDVGELNLVAAFGFTVAAVTVHRLLVRTVLAGYLLYTVPHLVFHLNHLSGFPAPDATTQTIALAIGVVLPPALLLLTRGHPHEPAERHASGSERHGDPDHRASP